MWCAPAATSTIPEPGPKPPIWTGVVTHGVGCEPNAPKFWPQPTTDPSAFSATDQSARDDTWTALGSETTAPGVARLTRDDPSASCPKVLMPHDDTGPASGVVLTVNMTVC